MNDPTTIVRSISTRTAIFEERADGILIERIFPKQVQNLADVQENLEALRQLSGDQPRALMFDVRPGLSTEFGVREAYNRSEGMKKLVGIAVIMNSAAGRIAGNFLLAIQTPSTPLRLFTDEEAAVTWLQRLARARR